MEILHQLPDPAALSKQEIIALLLREEYGFLPARPHTVTATVEAENKRFCAGKAPLVKLRLRCQAAWGEFSFPVYYVCPY